MRGRQLTYFFSPPLYDKEKLFWKDERDSVQLVTRLSAVREKFAALPEDAYRPESLKNALWSYAEEEGRGQVLWPTRYALSGRDKSPDPFELAALLGKDETLRRLDAAILLHHA